MERLTSNKSVSEMGMVELAHNSCFVKDSVAWYRDYSEEVDARTLARKLLKDFAEGDDSFTCDGDFDEYITACLEDGTDSIEGLIALFYRNLWAMAELHAHLKYYEDLQEQGKTLKLPCAVGDWVYKIKDGQVNFYKVVRIEVDGNKESDVYFKTSCAPEKWPFCTLDDFGKTVFLTEEEARKR